MSVGQRTAQKVTALIAAVDSNYNIWNAIHNQYWPAHYFIDAKGKVRDAHFGEGSMTNLSA